MCGVQKRIDVDAMEEKTKGSRKKMLGRKRAGKEHTKQDSFNKTYDCRMIKRPSGKLKKMIEYAMKKHIMIDKREDGTSRRYTSMKDYIRVLTERDFADSLEAFKTKHGDIKA
ncbi:hypothetical protein Tco_1069513 [Tanacetum coccineum]|uniref:Uncharacterized protein n=1 Tax=Tanacetum coccineum TaxID=301880 RepID=A0ABQ5HIS9_9ASTR